MPPSLKLAGKTRGGPLPGAVRGFVTAQLFSSTGTWMQRAAQDWLVIHLPGGGGTALGLLTALQFLPVLLLGSWGGALLDRYRTRAVLLVTESVLALQALAVGLLVMTDQAGLGLLYGAALLLGLTSAIDKPALDTLAGELATPTQPTRSPDPPTSAGSGVPGVLALNDAAYSLGRALGPVIAGLLIAAFGTAAAFLANALSFLPLMLTLTLLAARPGERERPPRGRGGVLTTLRSVSRSPDLALTLLLVTFVAAFGMNFQMTTTLMATQVYEQPAASFALAAAALALGAVGGSAIAVHLGSCRLRYIITMALAFGLLEAGCAAMPNFWAFCLLLVPAGAVLLLFWSAAKARLQVGVDEEARGRIMGLFQVCALGTTTLAAPLVGWVSQQAGPRAGLLLGGLVSVAAAVAAAGAVRHSSFRAATADRPA
ncbi:MFS transporter [Streptomyces sp. CA-256286]|uniref:MFS transporter n=1 Tax=Streptomyces sp. CA-256286 TaxID=2801033 RepID=UPI001A982303|nr:MFS transporter [Streptomyces sp. CA-256286]QTA37051.1 MFS transporter [Streptomyces sp. CA-256286]QTA37069.1 MFS transporter [Streptomyces sp. CA-256286]